MPTEFAYAAMGRVLTTFISTGGERTVSRAARTTRMNMFWDRRRILLVSASGLPPKSI
jgi:hypothetical protein